MAAWWHDSMGKERVKKEGIVGFKVEAVVRPFAHAVVRIEEGEIDGHRRASSRRLGRC